MDPMGLGIDGLMDDHWGGKSLDSRWPSIHQDPQKNATGRRLWVATLTSIPPRDASHVGTWIEVIGASVTTSGAGAKPVLLAREGIVYWTDALERNFSVFFFVDAYLWISSPKCQDEDDEVPNYKIITSIHIYIQSIHMRYGQNSSLLLMQGEFFCVWTVHKTLCSDRAPHKQYL
jgi:hypothetical protein